MSLTVEAATARVLAAARAQSDTWRAVTRWYGVNGPKGVGPLRRADEAAAGQLALAVMLLEAAEADALAVPA